MTALLDEIKAGPDYAEAFVEAQSLIVEQNVTMRLALQLMGVEAADVVDLQKQLLNRARYCGALARGAEMLMFEIEKEGRV